MLTGTSQRSARKPASGGRDREYRDIVDGLPEAVFVCRDDRLVYANKAGLALIDVATYPISGDAGGDFRLPDHMPRPWKDAARAVYASATEQRCSFSLFVGDRIRHYAMRLVPELDSHGKVRSLLALTYDETERLEAEIERDTLMVKEQAAATQAETAVRARDQFLSVVSHELRSPLHGIQSWTHVLERQLPDDMPPAWRRALQGIRTGVAQQVRLIEDLLDVTGMLNGELALARRTVALVPIVEAALASLRETAQSKAITIDAVYAVDANEWIEADPDRLQQIFWHLLSNAIKFTPSGGRIRISADATDEQVNVSVTDNGIGIRADFLPHLFRRFHLADASSTRAHSGLGLGLALVRHLTMLHGGRVSADSAGENRGSRFTVSFRRYRAPGSLVVMDSAPEPMTVSGTRILLIEDHDEARDSLSAVLSHAGAEVAAVSSGADALRYLASTSTRLPQLLLCDIAMPDEDGYAVLRRIRHWEASHTPAEPCIPAIALTAHSQRHDSARALSAGFQMQLGKPVILPTLIVAIANIARR